MIPNRCLHMGAGDEIDSVISDPIDIFGEGEDHIRFQPCCIPEALIAVS